MFYEACDNNFLNVRHKILLVIIYIVEQICYKRWTVCNNWKPSYLLIDPVFNLHMNVFHQEKKSSQDLVQVQHLYEAYFLLEKKSDLSEVQRYVFDSLLKHDLTTGNSLVLIRSVQSRQLKKDAIEPLKLRSLSFSMGFLNFYRPKEIDFTIWESCFAVVNVKHQRTDALLL